jgi:prefoldin subunit 5
MPPTNKDPSTPASSSRNAEAFQAVKERLSDKLGGFASAVLQVPAAVHHRTAPTVAIAASPDAAKHRERALSRLAASVHRALPAALQDVERELDAALERAEAVQRCLSVLEGAQARAQQRKARGAAATR